MRQYLKKVRGIFNGGLTINPGGIAVHEMKIAFDIVKDISSSANTATIEIWNLSESHRNSVGKELDEITLEAGYMPPEGGGNVGILFKGAIRDVEHKRQGADIVTRISCGDGDKAIRKAKLSKSYPKGTPVKDVVEDLYKELEKEGVKRGEWKFPDDMKQEFKRPYATCTRCYRELDTIGRGHGFYWNLQNQTMEIIPGDGYVGQVVLIAPETGMIDTPAITDNGVRVSCLLNPEIRPNRRVQVRSGIIDMNADGGMYRVSQASYRGDNFDGDFSVEVVGESVRGGKVDEGKR
ncbi:hypothetical protein AKG11_10335 [Shinella sp. SUS2]|uniref:phage protein n=1 Tax=unclassified Shinella TaxID=2643062 RepID=UPI00068082BA|nr:MULTISPECIES: hypothetical protein [unclassified Shinella]KNY16751.1 hypothetical protein AKG11_10335 [Shinella sp. SUS2]KOC73229.1 hypothetical protein AKG10_22635 [Shinella sp. GWS1]